MLNDVNVEVLSKGLLKAEDLGSVSWSQRIRDARARRNRAGRGGRTELRCRKTREKDEEDGGFEDIESPRVHVVILLCCLVQREDVEGVHTCMTIVQLHCFSYFSSSIHARNFHWDCPPSVVELNGSLSDTPSQV